MCETCFGSRKFNQEQLPSIRLKAKAYAVEINKTVVIYTNESGQAHYMETDAFNQHKPGQFAEYILPTA